jgi:hypothetical protein
MPHLTESSSVCVPVSGCTAKIVVSFRMESVETMNCVFIQIKKNNNKLILIINK